MRHVLGRFDRLEDRTAPAVFTVTDLADSGPGSLRAALAQANVAPDPDTINFAPNLENGTVSLISSADAELGPTALVVSSAVTINGNGQTIASAAQLTPLRLIRVTDQGQLTLLDLTLTGGSTGQTTLNVRGDGGAIASAGFLTLEGCTLIDNQANNGGAIQSDGTFVASDCTFQNNQADDRGGAVFDSGQAELDGCTLTNNQAGDGGAAWSEGAPHPFVMNNDTVATNSASRATGTANAGGIGIHNGDAALRHVTIVGNTVGSPGGTKGGGLLLWADAGAAAVMTLDNSIVFGSNGDVDVRALADPGAGLCSVQANTPNIVGSTAAEGGASFSGTGIVSVDPMLGPLQANGGKTLTMAPLPGSPALNAGAAVGLSTDQRGAGRDTPPDLGAYEVQHPLSPVGVPVESFVMYGPQPSASQNEAFVKGLYQATLLRQGSPAEVAAYVAALNNGTLTRAHAAQNFYNSPENRGNQVRFFYRYFLKREPSQQEIDFYVPLLQKGTDEAVIVKDFILSPEFTGQNNDTQFVNTMYYAVLGRAAAPFEVAFYVDALASGQTTRVQVVLNFLRSPESIQRVERGDTIAYLKRQPSALELSNVVGSVQGGATYGSLAIGQLGSQEFYDNAGKNL